MSTEEVGHQAGGWRSRHHAPQPVGGLTRRQVWRRPAPRAHSSVRGSRATAGSFELAEELAPSGHLEIVGLEKRPMCI